MDILLQVCMLVCLASMNSGQLFPFSSLHQYALKDSISTETAPAASVHQVKIETNERPSRQTGSAPEPHTVLVTPRPKYKPQNFVQEPAVSPNNRSIPAMMDDKSMQERMKAQEQSEKELMKTVLQTMRPPKVKTVVDSVPSLSVVIPAELTKPNNGPPDFLRPPRYPSVYNTKPVHTLSDFNTTPLREWPKGSKEPSKFYPHKEWHRKPDKKSNNYKRKIRGKTTEPNIHLESQIQWGPPSSSLDTFTHKTPTFHLDPFYERYIEHVLQEPQQQFTTFHETKITSGFSSHLPGLELDLGEDPDIPRVEYHTHGHQGPESYKFGYDTGHGKDRLFRFEEKNQEGSVKGQYGYYDKRGKLKVVNYEADQNGFRTTTL